MIRNKKICEAETYITGILNDGIISRPEEVSHSGNIVVDSLINHEYALAQKENIDFSISILIPASLPFLNGHLTIILGNLLENAIEACKKVSGTKKFIDLNISYSKEVFQLSLRNSCQPNLYKDKSGHYLTTKSDISHHGLGLTSVRQAVAYYNGEVEITDIGNEFQVVIIMYSPPNDNGN